MQKILLLIVIVIFTGCFKEPVNRAVKTIAGIQQKSNNYNFGKYYALLIYVDNYTYLNKLDTPKYDVKLTAKVLKERYGFQTEIIANPKNSDELIGVLDRLSQKLTSNDNLLIYYAGHGHYIPEAKAGYWQLQDAKEDSRVGWISVTSAINNTLSLMSAKHILVISDSCYSGALLRESSATLANREDAKYYNKLYQKKSRNALTSGGLEPVLDSDPINPNHSVFTNGLLYSLQNNSKPIFVLEEKFSEIKKYIQLKADQTPQYSDIRGTGHEMGGDFIFVDRFIKSEPISNKKISSVSTSLPIVTRGKNRINEGNKAKKRGDIHQVIKLYREACDLKNGIGCAKLGMIYHKQKDDMKAVIYFTKACSFGVQKACGVIKN